MGGRGGASGFGGTLSNQLAVCENRIRYDGVETAVVLDAKGKVLIDKSDGNTNQVTIDPADVSKLRDSVFTHNHPNGTAFSREDIETAYNCGVKIMRACHANGFYQIERQFDLGTSVPWYYRNFGYDYAQALDLYKTTTVDPIWNSSQQTYGDATRCNNMINDFRKDWLRKNAAMYGWKYTDGGRT